MTATFLPRRSGRVAGCVLGALLCLLTTALFALADASVSRAAPSGYAHARTQAAIASEGSRKAPSAPVASRAVADSDNPFEHGRLPVAGPVALAPCSVASRPAPLSDEPPVAAEAPLPERPPRA